MIEDYQEQLEEMSDSLRKMAKHIEGIDKSDLSSTHQHYLNQAVKLMRTAGSACEEAATWLDGVD